MCVCVNYYSMPNTCHMPLAASPLATCFDFSTQIHKKNPNANENETNVGVKMKTFVRKRENSLSVCVSVFPSVYVCVCVGSGQCWATFRVRVRVRWLSDVTPATSMRGLLWHSGPPPPPPPPAGVGQLLFAVGRIVRAILQADANCSEKQK